MSDDFFDSFAHMILTRCPICGEHKAIQVTPEQWHRFCEWTKRNADIHTVERVPLRTVMPEFSQELCDQIVTGTCPDCAAKLAGKN